jgi:hypothetical protein
MVQTLAATTSPTKSQDKADESEPAAWFLDVSSWLVTFAWALIFKIRSIRKKPLRITSPGNGAAATINTRREEDKVKYDQWSNKTFY